MPSTTGVIQNYKGGIMAGIQETKEAVAACAALIKVMRDLAKDGVQWTDAVALYDKYESDPAFKAKMDSGLKGAELISSELGDISLFEGLELLQTIRAEFRK